jgi:glucosamine--fructose-6-phosphate aminotransferase (isomerizing)
MTVVASGASRHAGLCGKIMIETLAGIPVYVEHASEFKHSNVAGQGRALVLAITQSGETADTMMALRAAREQNLPTWCISNVIDSSISREADIALYTNAGVERAIPATKSFTSQLVVLYVLALICGSVRRALDASELFARIRALTSIPGTLSRVLHEFDQQAKALASDLADGRPMLLAGRGIHHPVALEAALKLKEISYIHAEGHPTGELRHGITALVDREQPIIVIATRDVRDSDSMLRFRKTLSVVDELRRHSSRLILMLSEDDAESRAFPSPCVVVPAVDELLSPLLEVVPLQLLAYHIAVKKGLDVDHPRNLVKSVTTE